MFTAPTNWELIWKDEGSGAKQDGSMWRPISADEEYECVGSVPQRGYQPPVVRNYRCVHRSLLKKVTASDLIWNDKGSGAKRQVSMLLLPSSRSFVAVEGRPREIDTYDLDSRKFVSVAMSANANDAGSYTARTSTYDARTSAYASMQTESQNLEKTYEKETERQPTPAQIAKRIHREERMLGAGKEGKIALNDEMREFKLEQKKEKLKESNERREAEERRLKLEKEEPAKAPSAGNAKNSSLKSRSLPEVETVQLALRARGLYDDGIDGLMGKNTAEGIKQWQRRRHLTVTGKLRRSENQRIELICGVFPQAGNCGKEYKPEPDKSSFFSRQWTLALFVALLTGWLADWLGLISAVLSVACLALYILAMPKEDKRFTTGYKDGATPASFDMVLYPAIAVIVFWGYAWGVGALCWDGFVAGNIDCNYCRIGTIGYDGVVKSYPRGFLPANF